MTQSMIIRLKRSSLALSFLLIFFAAGGGGGGGGDGTTTLSGTVAKGAAFSGNVIVLDSEGNSTEKAITEGTGAYSVDVIAANNPYMLKAYDPNDNTTEALFSVLDSPDSDGGTVVNITPLTSVIAANFLQEDPTTAFDKDKFQSFARENRTNLAEKMTAAVADMKNKIKPLMGAMKFGDTGIEQFDPIKSTFSVNDDLDMILQSVNIEKKANENGFHMAIGDYVYVDKWGSGVTDHIQDKNGAHVDGDSKGAILTDKLSSFPEEVFEILQKKTHSLTTTEERETAISAVLDKIVAKIKATDDISVIYGGGSDTSGECAGTDKPYLCAIHVDPNMDGTPDEMSRMIEVSFPEDERFFQAGLQYSLALPWQIAAFTQNGCCRLSSAG